MCAWCSCARVLVCCAAQVLVSWLCVCGALCVCALCVRGWAFVCRVLGVAGRLFVLALASRCVSRALSLSRARALSLSLTHSCPPLALTLTLSRGRSVSLAQCLTRRTHAPFLIAHVRRKRWARTVQGAGLRWRRHRCFRVSSCAIWPSSRAPPWKRSKFLVLPPKR